LKQEKDMMGLVEKVVREEVARWAKERDGEVCGDKQKRQKY
jgi:hypothetical protein